MSTLTDFDTITNQNVIAGLASVPKQCMVMDGSRLFAGNPSLPCAPPYGSGQFEAAALFEQAVQYAAAATTAAASHVPFHSTVPPIYSPSPSGNNNMRTTNDTTVSSQIDEGCSLDDDEDSSILSNLPNSCHDFELKELHIRLERNHSSPLIGGHSSPALSSRLSSNCPSAEPPTDPAEPEDLEVQFINECFEEQQRQSQMYQSGDLKTLFYHGSSELDSSKVTNRSGTDKSGQSSLERPERLPYAKKLSSHDPLSGVTNYDIHPITSPTFLNLSENFEPLSTLKSESLIQKRVRKDQKASPSCRRVSEPIAQKPPLFWSSGLRIEGSGFGSEELFESIDSSRSFVEDKKRHVSFDNYFRGSTPISDCATPDSVRCEDETEALAKGVIESLFSGVAITPLTPTEDFKEELRKACTSKQNKAVRKLYMDNLSELESSEKPDKELFPVVDMNKPSAETDKFECIGGLSDVSGQSSSQAKLVDAAASSIPQESVIGDDDGDSWENLDDSKLEEQMSALKLEIASKAPRRPISYFAPPVEAAIPWDPFLLPHVLEAYDVPEYKLAEDVVNALAATDWGNATVKWLERKIVFVVFASERQARDALVLHKHQWLRLRPLAKSPARVQEKAREIQAQLKPTRARPKTNAGVARRMVESTLGMRSSVSKEQREAERKQLSDAKAAKKNSVRWDD
ncbi:hypothetical protein GCK32_000085 [Trichostrongylus colubriformis]|uniref:Uncharacterized protein n=1 Tax=Trichostrongylus colubriformis TaxID=6319 RepID=A0AAN8J2F9_TRICO